MITTLSFGVIHLYVVVLQLVSCISNGEMLLWCQNYNTMQYEADDYKAERVDKNIDIKTHCDGKFSM